MPVTLQVHEPLLVNTLGHLAGALIFGIFLFLLLGDRVGARLRSNRLAVTACSLALFWNCASLAVLAFPDERALLPRLILALGSSALSLLPAVLLQLALDGRFRAITGIGYALSTVSIAMHMLELVRTAPQLHRLGLMLITTGFGALTVAGAACVLLYRDPNRRRVTSRLLGTMSLFLFAISFVHFGDLEAHSMWEMELLVHHAGIPLALFVLLQDYRSVLLDAFIRFLANILLAAVFAFGIARLSAKLPNSTNPLEQALLTMGMCLALILFALLRSRLQVALTRIVFQRPDLERTLSEFRARKAAPEAEYLDWVSIRLAEFMGAAPVAAPPAVGTRLAQLDLVFPALVAGLPDLREDLEAQGVEAVIPLRLSHAEVHMVLLGRRRGGRRYLSEDLESLARLATQAVEHVEQFREVEVRRLVSQAELRALQSQIHPHFLFNALNTLYGVIPRDARGARQTVLNLADILRYFLRTDRIYIPLEEELSIVKAYLEIESLRLGPKLRTEIHVEPEALRSPIPVLSIQPLVENAVKHGVASRAEGGSVRLEAALEQDHLRIAVHDSGAGFESDGAKGHGVGLENVRQRLKLCYGPASELEILSDPQGTTVVFRVPVEQPAEVER